MNIKLNILKNELSDIQKDAMREVGNIGAAHAATALSQMLNETIIIDVTKSHIIGIEDLRRVLGDPEELFSGVYMQVYGEGTHNLIMLFPYDISLKLVDMLFKRPPGTSKELSSKDESALEEIGNVCACAYLNALANLLGLTLFPSVPGLAIDMLSAIIEYPIMEIGMREDYVVIIETEFIQDDTQFSGFFLFMPDTGVQQAIMDKFKVAGSSD